MRVREEAPTGCGWSADKTRFYWARGQYYEREPDHDAVVDAVVKLFSDRVIAGKRLASGRLEDRSMFSFFDLLDIANDLAQLPPRKHQSRYAEDERVRDGHIHDACVRLGIPIYWVDNCFAPLIKKYVRGIQYSDEKRRHVFANNRKSV